MKQIVVIFMLIILMLSCSPKKKIETSPASDSFFEKARFIMTKEEKAIYKHLPDQMAKQEYIKEFWKKRDPIPETEENENKIEFEERITYANRWFKEHRGENKGWDTQRGRILLQLGFPDRREFGDHSQTNRNPSSKGYGSLLSTKRIPMERWIYYRWQLLLIFTDLDDSGKLKLIRIPATLLTALDFAKFSLDLRDKSALKRAFKFELAFRKDHIQVEIPIKKVSFDEKNNKMISKFKIDIYIYLDYNKIDHQISEKTITKSKAEILKTKSIKFDIPYTPTQKGTYHIDVIIEEELTSSKYRNFTKFKNR